MPIIEKRLYFCDDCGKELLPSNESPGSYIVDTTGQYVARLRTFPTDACLCDKCLNARIAGAKVHTGFLYKEDVDRQVKEGVNY